MICFEQKCSNDHKFFLISESGLVGKKIIGRCHKPELKPGGGFLFVSAYRGKSISYIFGQVNYLDGVKLMHMCTRY